MMRGGGGGSTRSSDLPPRKKFVKDNAGMLKAPAPPPVVHLPQPVAVAAPAPPSDPIADAFFEIAPPWEQQQLSKMDGAFVGRTVLVQWFDEGWQLGVIESYKDKLYFIEYGRRAASLPAANDLVIRHCGKKRKVNDLADHNQFPMRLFGNNVDAKRGSWALLKKVLDEVKPLTVVCTSRPMDEKKTPKEYNEILKGKRNTLMQLEGLHKDDVRDMLCSMFKVDAMEDEIVSAEALAYINRLSDWIFVAGRVANNNDELLKT